MSLSISDKSVFCVFHQTSEAEMDPAPSQCALSQVPCRAVVLVVKNQIPTIPQLPNSPDVALCNIQLLGKIKIELKGYQIVSAE
jgi:hypothetical protein